MVFDEADMLLTGGFEAPTRYLLTLLKEADRASMITAICADLGISEQEFRSLPLLMRRTGLKGAPELLSLTFCSSPVFVLSLQSRGLSCMRCTLLKLLAGQPKA